MPSKRWNIKELLDVTSRYLNDKEIDSPRLCAEVLLAHQLGMNRVQLYLSFDQPLKEEEVAGYRGLIKRRLNREPVQYITGKQEFWSLDIQLDRRVLIPRPETEILVERVLDLCRDQLFPSVERPEILEIGTGSGALSIALASEIQEACLWALDISSEALSVAAHNADQHGLRDRIRLVQGDLWPSRDQKSRHFDAIVSNPPYIPSETYEALPPEVRDYEPRQALDGGEGGMVFIRRIIRQGPDFMKPGGWLILEMDPGQTEEAMELMSQDGRYLESARFKDYSHQYRGVVGKNRGETR